MKICPICQSSFIPFKRYKDSQKTCSSKCSHRLYAQNNPEKMKAARDKFKAKNPDANRLAHKKWKYGLSIKEQEDLFQKALNRCMTCGSTEVLCIDHCHDTGKVRGILCRKCNAALGLINDRIEVLENMIKYLKEEE